MNELVLDAAEELGLEVQLDGTEATDEIEIESEFNELVLDGEGLW